MADDIVLNAGSGGDTIRADDDGTAKWQYVKLAYGADNTQTIVTSTASNPLPVALSDTDNAVLDTIAASAAIIDNSVFADDAAFTLTTSSVTIAGAIRDDALSTLSAVEGDAVPLRVSSTGALHVTGASGATEYIEDDAASGGESGPMILGVRQDADTSPVSASGDFHTLVFDAAGNLKVNVKAVDASNILDDAAFTVGTSEVVPIAGVYTTDTVDAGDAGALAMDASRRLLVSLEVDNVGVALESGGNLDTIAGDTTSLDSKVTACNTGAVTISSALPAGTNAIGDVGISGARTSGGTTPSYNDGTCTLTELKSSGGQIYWIHAMNATASVRWLQLFNVANGSITLGTTTPTLEFMIPTLGDTNGAGFTLAIPNGIAFGTAINYAVTTTKGGATAGTADDVTVNIGYA